MFRTAQVTKLNISATESSQWCKDAVFFKVQNGRGKLCHISGPAGRDYNYPSQFCLNGKPLVQGYYPVCPTCYGMLATGYGIENVDCRELAAIRKVLNCEYTGLENAFNALLPLLKLLDDGLYMLADTELAPTDGKHFFYNVPNKLTQNMACGDSVYNSDYYAVTAGFPAFLYPTQSPKTINMQQVDEYRKKLSEGCELRGLAFYEKGFICALLDGHHKAIAAAQLGIKLKCLTIVPADGCFSENNPMPPDKRKLSDISFSTVHVKPEHDILYGERYGRVFAKRRTENIQIADYSLTDERFADMDAFVAAHYHSLESICLLDAADLISDDITDAVIDEWLASPNDENAVFLEYLMIHRAETDLPAAYKIAEKVIHRGLTMLPQKEAWKVVLMCKGENAENLAIDYVASHNKTDKCWDIVTSYWD